MFLVVNEFFLLLLLLKILIGTSHSGGYSHSCVVYALKQCGYRLIDTAKRYGTEEFISYAIKVSLILIHCDLSIIL